MNIADGMSQTISQPMVDGTAMNVIVVLSLLFAAGFFLAWAASPRLRAWIEKPGYRFQKNTRRYDQGLSERDRL